MARGTRAKGDKAAPPPADGAEQPTGPLPLPSPVASTNLIIADLVLRSAGGLLRDRMEKGLLKANYDERRAEKLVDNRSLVTSAVLWGVSRMARKSPLGLAAITAGLAAKVFYDRGKRLEERGQTPPAANPPADKK